MTGMDQVGSISSTAADTILGSITVTEMVEVLGTLYCMGGCEKVFDEKNVFFSGIFLIPWKLAWSVERWEERREFVQLARRRQQRGHQRGGVYKVQQISTDWNISITVTYVTEKLVILLNNINEQVFSFWAKVKDC